MILNLYFKNIIIELHILYVLNMPANFLVNQMLFTMQSINSSFINYSCEDWLIEHIRWVMGHARGRENIRG